MSGRKRPWAWVALVVFIAACRRAPEPKCIADSIGILRNFPSVPKCRKDALLCRAKCFAGDAQACLGLAYESEEDPKNAEETQRLYRQACLHGAANACTNYAATIWAHGHSPEGLPCAQRTFEKACAAKEPFACGMVGRLMLESTRRPSYAEARKYLETACNDVGGFPCRVLAKHLESGKLGAYEPGRIRALLKQACEGGDSDACGDPPNATDTFR